MAAPTPSSSWHLLEYPLEVRYQIYDNLAGTIRLVWWEAKPWHQLQTVASMFAVSKEIRNEMKMFLRKHGRVVCEDIDAVRAFLTDSRWRNIRQNISRITFDLPLADLTELLNVNFADLLPSGRFSRDYLEGIAKRENGKKTLKMLERLLQVRQIEVVLPARDRHPMLRRVRGIRQHAFLCLQLGAEIEEVRRMPRVETINIVVKEEGAFTEERDGKGLGEGEEEEDVIKSCSYSVVRYQSTPMEQVEVKAV